MVNSKFVLTFFGCAFRFKITPSTKLMAFRNMSNIIGTKMNSLPVEHLKIEIQPGVVVVAYTYLNLS